jgi:hypothetical protein
MIYPFVKNLAFVVKKIQKILSLNLNKILLTPQWNPHKGKARIVVWFVKKELA